MRLYQSTFTFLAFLALSVSCSKKDHEVEPSENCRYAGKSYHYEEKGPTNLRLETYESHFKQNDQGNLALVTVSKATSYEQDGAIIATFTEDETYEFKYNSDGFLMELKQYNLLQQQGTAKYDFSYPNYFTYRKGKVETTNINTFTYTNGLAQSSMNAKTVIVQGDNEAAKTFTEDSKTAYEYDSQGIIQTITSGGGVTNYKNGIRASNTSGSTTLKYDESGRITSFSYPTGEQTFKYDQKGNQILYEGFENGKRRFSEAKKFDNHKNPETLIPYKYKGIPDGFMIGYSSSDPNNMTESAYTFMDQAPYIQTNTWTYNANGLPDTSTLTAGTGDYKSTWITKFKYENCN